MVALLRGVNVGGAGALHMAELRAIATEVGLEQVSTYIQSGNLVFSSDRPTDAVASSLRAAIGRATPLDPEVIVRTLAELEDVIDRSPFLRRGADPGHLHVVFLAGDAALALEGFDASPYRPEEVVAMGGELHLLLPQGVGRSKLATALTRHTGSVGTMRSWRTVTKLVALADALT